MYDYMKSAIFLILFWFGLAYASAMLFDEPNTLLYGFMYLVLAVMAWNWKVVNVITLDITVLVFVCGTIGNILGGTTTGLTTFDLSPQVAIAVCSLLVILLQKVFLK